MKISIFTGLCLLILLLAQVQFAPAVEYGKGVPANRGAESVSTNFNLGMEAYQKGEFAQALSYFKQAADAGDVQATVQLGLMYDFGKGVFQDYTKAMSWYLKAAEKGEPRALYLIGHMFEYGEGVTKDPAEAFNWYLKSAQKGHASAQYEVGKFMTRESDKQTPDFVEGIKWLRVAAEQCHIKSLELLQQLSDGMTVDTSQCPGDKVN